MTPLPVLIAALAASMAPCSPPLGGRPHYVIPGALRDVTYHDQLTLDAYAPAGEPRPAAIIIHGSEGTKITHVTQLFEVLDRAGFAWFSVDYHSSEDVAEAIRYVRCPGRFNITPEIVLIGEDTGAGIALSLAAHGGFRGVVTFGTKLGDTGPSPGKENAMKDGTTAAALMFHGTSDEESPPRSEEHTSELQSPYDLVCRLLLEKKKKNKKSKNQKQPAREEDRNTTKETSHST